MVAGAGLGYRIRVLGLEAANARLEAIVTQRTAALAAETERLSHANTEKAGLLEQLGDQAREFERLAREDGLTGLANRRELDRRLGSEFERAKRHRYPLAVAIIDADHFKQVNDRYSHAVGDDVLRQLGHLLRDNCREIDFVARFGGEEFVLVLPHTSASQARAICERLGQTVAQHPWSSIAPDLQVTVTIGIAATQPGSGESAESESHEKLLSNADARLYTGKHAGRNRVVD
jgi:diguanylate cyclase (GGDEF)-like protein